MEDFADSDHKESGDWHNIKNQTQKNWCYNRDGLTHINQYIMIGFEIDDCRGRW